MAARVNRSNLCSWPEHFLKISDGLGPDLTTYPFHFLHTAVYGSLGLANQSWLVLQQQQQQHVRLLVGARFALKAVTLVSRKGRGLLMGKTCSWAAFCSSSYAATRF